MRVLGLDTATPATTVAVLDSDRGAEVERRDDPAVGERPRHTARVIPLLVEAMRGAGVGWEEIDRLAVGVGPGTFTGLRVGVATALGLASSREIPLVGVSTLHALAFGAASQAAPDEDAVVAVIDGRRGEVFAAGWSLDDVRRPGAVPLLGPRAVGVEGLAGLLREQGRRWLAVGDGSVAFRTALERSGARIPTEDSERNRVSAIDHCRLALGLPPEPPGEVRPEYLRPPDAEISHRASQP